MALGSAALKFVSTALYAIEFFCAAIVLGIFSYFLSVEADRNEHIPTWEKAVTGLSGAVVLYTIMAVLLTCFLAGKTVFALLGLLFDLLCCGAMVAIAIMTRDGAHKCSGNNVRSPLGNGASNSRQGFGSNGQGDKVVYAASLGTACRLNTACFAVSILGALLFLFSALLQMCLSRVHKKEKRYGPSPSNGYTQGSGTKFWQRNRRTEGRLDPEVAAVPVTTGSLAPTGGHEYRPSHDTAYTGSTVAAPNGAYEHNKPVVGGYHTAPTGTYNNNTAGTTLDYRNNTATNY